MYDMNQQQRTEQKTLLSQKLIQSSEILQMDTQELERYIELQAEENPMIDLEAMEKKRAESDSKTSSNNREREELAKKLEWLNHCDEQNRVYYSEEAEEAAGREDWNVSVEENSLKDYLMSQLILQLKTKQDQQVMEFLIDSLDRRGYLTDTPEELCQSLGLKPKVLNHYLDLLKSLEPAGIGAATPEECLALQLSRLYDSGKLSKVRYKRIVTLASDWLKTLGKQHFTQVSESLHLDPDVLQKDYRFLQSLNPIPGNSFSSREEMRYVKPDVTIVKFENYFEILVNDLYLPRVSVNPYYLELLKNDDNAEVTEYLKGKYQQLEWVRHCISERASTLQAVTREIVALQSDFFEQPDGKRNPMGLKDIALRLDIHESTVSRAVKNKFLQCARGIFPMSYFFVRKASFLDDGAGISPEEIKTKIRDLIETENPARPLSDQRIADRLELSGIPISRRTVAKYRSSMLIPDTAGRRQRS